MANPEGGPAQEPGQVISLIGRLGIADAVVPSDYLNVPESDRPQDPAMTQIGGHHLYINNDGQPQLRLV